MKLIDPYIGKLFMPGDNWRKPSTRFPGSPSQNIDLLPILIRAHLGNSDLYGPNDDIWLDMVMRKPAFDGVALCVRKFELYFDGLNHHYHLNPKRQAYSSHVVYEFLLNKKYFLVKDKHMHMLELVAEDD